MTSKGRTFGHNGVDVGTIFKTKAAARKAGIHAAEQGGIHGDQHLGAFSVCLSKGYEDNIDNGNIIIYVGSGGRDVHGDQIHDQSFEHSYNKSLFISSQTKRPVRVVRGATDKSYYAPTTGYRYDGLYVVDEANLEKGNKGFNMCTFKLRRIEEEGQKPIPTKSTLTLKKMTKMMKSARST
ncbi:SRA-YDG protein [Rhizopogon vinicolor AM-OR11-026]|uniref:SRA-YDG protein n=1 Tax=Rhizopogon vinicolor AM-OR11-026 TaxID=1314800 RepID=A0A1B7MYC5_9AGAM|nr:SRA-YDG protein [Rhizopogon vinicolor AM-OR11-026]